MEVKVDLSKGGVVSVVLGQGYETPTEFAYHPQVHTVDALKVDPKTEGWIPSQTKLVIFTDRLPNTVYQYLQAIIRQRKLIYLPRKTQGAVAAELRKLLPAVGKEATGNGNGTGTGPVAIETEQRTSKGAIPKQAPRGSVSELARAHADLSKGSAEEGRRLFRIAQEQGLKTTLASVIQSISLLKRKRGRGDVPVSAIPEGAGIQVFKGITEAIEALTRIRDHAETLEKDKAQILSENAALKARIELLKEAWKGME